MRHPADDFDYRHGAAMDAMNQTAQKRQHQRWMLAKTHAATVRDRMIKTPEQVYEITRQAKEDRLAWAVRLTQSDKKP